MTTLHTTLLLGIALLSGWMALLVFSSPVPEYDMTVERSWDYDI